MSTFSTPAILLRRSSYGDYDLIVTLLTLNKGKLTVIAKNAKKSRKRFPGLLELFSVLHIECRTPRARGMAVLQDATLENPFSGIRGNIMKTSYASYWAELVNLWLEEGKEQTRIYHLLRYCLDSLDSGIIGNEELSIIFQLRFLSFSGLSPNFSECNKCHTKMDEIKGNHLFFELAKGGILCKGCSSSSLSSLNLTKGIVKQLLWIQENDLKTAGRLKFNQASLREGLKFLEKFIVFHIGKEPKSLKFLRNLCSQMP
ncbi:MAG: DNA repair protein RecO [Desulfobacteraceae bacterium]|nr:DNA repair protein RecO [Desulfobacteraceae bacterium]MBC2757745.1 DNA repair protein RecO [Desulfobacteraceae bacterium]